MNQKAPAPNSYSVSTCRTGHTFVGDAPAFGFGAQERLANAAENVKRVPYVGKAHETENYGESWRPERTVASRHTPRGAVQRHALSWAPGLPSWRRHSLPSRVLSSLCRSQGSSLRGRPRTAHGA